MSDQYSNLPPWPDEFDSPDDVIGARINLRERTQRAAMHRRGMAQPSQQAAPSPLDAAHIPLSHHASHRLKNRGITVDQVRLITDFGRPQRVHGATRYALDKDARARVLEALSPDELRGLGSLDIVAVLADDGTLITASHRTTRLRQKISHH